MKKAYELVLLLDTRLSQDEQKALQASIDAATKGIVVKTDDLGIQQLQYDLNDVRGNDKAHVISMAVEGTPAEVDAVYEAIKYEKGLLRYKVFSLKTLSDFHTFADLEKLSEGYYKEDEKRVQPKKSIYRKDENGTYITWKAVTILKQHITRFANMKKRSFTGVSVKQQKKIRK